MASALSDKLSRLVKQMRGQARITEENVQDMLREVRMALLEADVALPVVRDFIARVKDKALGAEVVGSLSPGQALVGIVHRELAATMGEGVSDIYLVTQRAPVKTVGLSKRHSEDNQEDEQQNPARTNAPRPHSGPLRRLILQQLDDAP